METVFSTTTYANISQRAADSFRRLLAEPLSEAGDFKELHTFFKSLYNTLYDHPENFGLPLGEDISIAEDGPNAKERKQEVKRRLDKPKNMILSGLDFLRLVGTQGRLDGQTLVLDGYAAALKQTKMNKSFLAGLEYLGLTLSVNDDTARLQYCCSPWLLVTLQTLARSCTGFKEAEMGRFQFARCDGRALQQAGPEPAEVYRAFDGQEYFLVMRLHEFFSQKGYRVQIEANGSLAWNASYQGSRKIKATPLFQITYDDRYARPLRMQIKCASTQRIAALLPLQPRLLQEDFNRRTFPCRGDDCGWCRNNKTLGPTPIELNGQTRTVCWYTYPDIHELNEHTFDLVREYEQMHAQLA